MDEEAPTTGTVTRMITTWQKRTKLAKQQHSTVRLELQFLAHHKKQYNELGDNFSSNSHALKSRTALENFKLLIELDIKVLFGADVQWAVFGNLKDHNHPAKLRLWLHALLLANNKRFHFLLLSRGMTTAVPVRQAKRRKRMAQP